MLQQRTTSAQHLLPVILQAWIHKRNIRPLKMLRKSGLLGKGWSPAAGDQSKVHTLLRHREDRSSTQLPHTLTHRHFTTATLLQRFSKRGNRDTSHTRAVGQGSFGPRLLQIEAPRPRLDTETTGQMLCFASPFSSSPCLGFPHYRKSQAPLLNRAIEELNN